MEAVTYINNDYEMLAEALQQLVSMRYFASVEYDSANTAVVCRDSDENAVLTIANTTNGQVVTISFRLADGTVKDYTLATRAVTTTGTSNNGYLRYVYVCSGGAYIYATTGTNTGFAGIIISRTNNGAVGVAILGTIGTSATPISGRLNVNAVATDDSPDQIETAFTYGAPTVRNQAVLTDFPTCAAPTVPSHFPDVRYTLTSQFGYINNVSTPPINFEQDGKRYLWIGYFAIRDEEEI